MDSGVCVVGLGEIGGEVFRSLKKSPELEVFGSDKDRERASAEGCSTSLQKAEVYFVCVYSTQQVLDVVKEISLLAENPLLVIEATVFPGTVKKIEEIFSGKPFSLVLFPHRFNPGDSEHHVFNLWRVAGALNQESEARFKEFISLFTDKIHFTSIETAELCKPLENALRFIEIAVAEDLKLECEKKGIDFEKLREAVNTKWNIDLKEARDGINGKCLPKDAKITADFFRGFESLSKSIKLDEEYKKRLKK